MLPRPAQGYVIRAPHTGKTYQQMHDCKMVLLSKAYVLHNLHEDLLHFLGGPGSSSSLPERY